MQIPWKLLVRCVSMFFARIAALLAVLIDIEKYQLRQTTPENSIPGPSATGSSLRRYEASLRVLENCDLKVAYKTSEVLTSTHRNRSKLLASAIVDQCETSLREAPKCQPFETTGKGSLNVKASVTYEF